MVCFVKALIKQIINGNINFGRLSYIPHNIKDLLLRKTHHLKIESENINIEDDFIFGSISNSTYIGGFPVFKEKEVKLDDKKFDILFIKKPKNIFHRINLLLHIIKGNLDNDYICYFQASELKITAEKEIDWTVDGEYGGTMQEIHISNAPKQLRYLSKDRS